MVLSAGCWIRSLNSSHMAIIAQKAAGMDLPLIWGFWWGLKFSQEQIGQYERSFFSVNVNPSINNFYNEDLGRYIVRFYTHSAVCIKCCQQHFKKANRYDMERIMIAKPCCRLRLPSPELLFLVSVGKESELHGALWMTPAGPRPVIRMQALLSPLDLELQAK